MRAASIAFFAVPLLACSKGAPSTDTKGASSTTTPSQTPSTDPENDPALLEKEAIASATSTWLSLNKKWQAIQVIVSDKKTAPKTCAKASAADNSVGLSIGSYGVEELAKAGAPHSPLFDGGATTSDKLTKILRLPFLERERRSSDWNPKAATTKLAEFEKTFFPMTVIRIDDFVAPELLANKTFKPGRASSTVYFFESPSEACSLRIASRSDKTISALSIDGNTGGAEVLNLRFANALQQTVQRDAGAKLVALGKLGSLDPVVPGH